MEVGGLEWGLQGARAVYKVLVPFYKSPVLAVYKNGGRGQFVPDEGRGALASGAISVTAEDRIRRTTHRSLPHDQLK